MWVCQFPPEKKLALAILGRAPFLAGPASQDAREFFLGLLVPLPLAFGKLIVASSTLVGLFSDDFGCDLMREVLSYDVPLVARFWRDLMQKVSTYDVPSVARFWRDLMQKVSTSDVLSVAIWARPHAALHGRRDAGLDARQSAFQRPHAEGLDVLACRPAFCGRAVRGLRLSCGRS